MAGQDNDDGSRRPFSNVAHLVRGDLYNVWADDDAPNKEMLRAEHHAFVTGSGQWMLSRAVGKRLDDAREQEYVPDLLPAPLLQRPLLVIGPTSARTPQVQGGAEEDPNYFSAVPNTTTSETSKQSNQGEGADGEQTANNPASTSAGTRVSTDTTTPTTITSSVITAPPIRSKISQATKSKMAGRGRGRGGGFGPNQLKGATWEIDPNIKLDAKPSELFPPHPNLKKPAPLTEREVRQIKNYRNLQSQIHRGPLYTQPTKRDAGASVKTFSEEQVNAQYGGNAKADMDPFTGVETYSMRYAPKKNALPKLSDRPFDKSLFPKELWDTLDGKEGEAVKKHLDRIAQKKKNLLSGGSKNASEKTKILLEKIMNATEGAEEGEEDEEEDEGAADSEFDDDDGGDYDAEQYFDGGDGGDDDEDGGGGEEF